MINLKTLPFATKQEVFDQVSNHMLTQKKKSFFYVLDEEGDKVQGACAYRSPDGLKCAAGCLIGDDEYHERMDDYGEGADWDTLVIQSDVPAEHCDFIKDLQDIHDLQEPIYWEQGLKFFAYENNLKFNVNN